MKRFIIIALLAIGCAAIPPPKLPPKVVVVTIPKGVKNAIITIEGKNCKPKIILDKEVQNATDNGGEKKE